MLAEPVIPGLDPPGMPLVVLIAEAGASSHVAFLLISFHPVFGTEDPDPSRRLDGRRPLAAPHPASPSA
jgi:hypothetical protein